MKHWRITKYDPALRDSRGRYLEEDWTSIADIGNKFEGVLLTEEHYQKVENAYIDTVFHLFDEIAVDTVSVLDWEEYDFAGIEAYQQDNADPTAQKALELARSSQPLQPTSVPTIARLILRELAWCRFSVPDELYLHFGNDYYMYLGSVTEPSQTLAFARNSGLYVEPKFISPYL